MRDPAMSEHTKRKEALAEHLMSDDADVSQRVQEIQKLVKVAMQSFALFSLTALLHLCAHSGSVRVMRIGRAVAVYTLRTAVAAVHTACAAKPFRQSEQFTAAQRIQAN
jgi:hypothetical protein